MVDVDPAIVDFGKRLSIHAGHKKKMAIFISHYPISVASAQAMTENHKIYAYLSGHVHCTSNNPKDAGPDGVDWKWYRFGAGHTDDKTFNGCFFSTGTTDVLLAKHGQIFKEIENLRTASIEKKKLNQFKSKAASAFNCEAKMATVFERVDPFNPQNTLAGFICRKKGNRQGSLYITHVNGIQLAPQMIYGTPKLEYPYVDQSDNRLYKDIDAYKYMIANKWNGMNVMFYRYIDAAGREFFTAKSKGTPFLSDTEVGNFLTLTREAMEDDEFISHYHSFTRSKSQSITFELCGKKEPHLVAYDFDIALKPLFVTRQHGGIKPFSLQFECKRDSWQERCQKFQEDDYALNEEYRKKNGLEHKYEYNHFATEGKVLYCVDKNGYVIDRTMYKVKPKDIEEVHWQTFDKDMQERVREAVRKIKMNEEAISEETLCQELDMGHKEWSKFGRQVLAFANSNGEQEAKVVVMCGLPGSGKSTIANIMKARGWVRVSQDELGSRGACAKVMRSALEKGKNVVVDRCNFNAHQRKQWVDIAVECGVQNISCFHLAHSPERCFKLASNRKNHPTIKDEKGLKKAIDNMYSQWTDPAKVEGFIRITDIARPVRADTLAEMAMGEINESNNR
jgi:predicted kinase